LVFKYESINRYNSTKYKLRKVALVFKYESMTRYLRTKYKLRKVALVFKYESMTRYTINEKNMIISYVCVKKKRRCINGEHLGETCIGH